MDSNVQPVTLWPNPIYKAHYPHDLTSIADWALDICKDQDDYLLEKGGGKSSYGVVSDAILRSECTELKNWVIEHSKLVWNTWELTDHPRFVHHSWVNWHPPGAWTDEHDHSGVHMVITIYLKQPENGGHIQFKDPMQYTWAAWPKLRASAFDWRTLHVSTGDVLFFPGFLRHKTQVNKSEEDRLVMTTNIVVDYFHKE
jgi:uncharacterized protein (TIGR02466 family)